MAFEPEILDDQIVDDSNQRENLLDTWLGLTGQGPLPEGPLVLPVLSGSMRPAISLGSRIRIEPCSTNVYRVGEVTVYLDGDRLVAHRVLWVLGRGNGGWAFQKGDANRFGHWIRRDKIKGIVKEVLATEDSADVPPGLNPFSPEAARISRQDFFRNFILAGPRWIRNLLTGRRSENPGGE